MKYAFDKDNILARLTQFIQPLQKIHPSRASCLLQKINVYLAEYLGKDFKKEFEMAFVSIGQKYGFESIADSYRKEVADARVEERENIAREMLTNNEPIDKIIRYSHLSENEVLEIKAKLDSNA